MTDLSESALRAVLETLGWPKPRQLRRLRGGHVNPAWCVNEEVVIRFNTRDRDQKKFAREALCYKMRPLGHLTPRVLYYLASHPAFDGEILVTEKCPGRRLSDDWPRMEPLSKTKLAHEAATILAQLHEIRFEKFGAIEDSEHQFAKWKTACESQLEKALHQARELNVVSQEIADRARRAFTNVGAALDEVTSPRLVHGDFHFGNLLWHGEKITAVLDFEWSLAGDSLMDLRNRTHLYDSAHGSEMLVEAEYLRLQRFEPPSARLEFYRMLNKIELLSTSARHWRGRVSWGDVHHLKVEQSLAQILAKLTP